MRKKRVAAVGVSIGIVIVGITLILFYQGRAKEATELAKKTYQDYIATHPLPKPPPGEGLCGTDLVMGASAEAWPFWKLADSYVQYARLSGLASGIMSSLGFIYAAKEYLARGLEPFYRLGKKIVDSVLKKRKMSPDDFIHWYRE